MKKVKFLSMMLAAGMFAACSDTLDDAGGGNAGGTNYKGETGYINISLNLPTTSGGNSRANDDFDDGLAAEYNVKSAIIALFYGADEASATCQYAFKLSEGDFQLTGTTTDNITSYYASGVRMIAAPSEGQNVYALAILNPTDDFVVTSAANATDEDNGDAVLTTKLQITDSTDFEGSLSALNQVASLSDISTIASTADGGSFLMTNAPIAETASFKSSAQPTATDYVTTLAPIKVYNEKSLAEGAASDNPIYVERTVAKTTVKVNNSSASLTVDSDVPAYDEATVTFEGWRLQNTNKKYYPVRKVTDETYGWTVWKGYFTGTAIDEINRFFGQVANPYRTYWGIDPNYTTVLGEGEGDNEKGGNFNILTAVADDAWNTVGINSTSDYSGKLVEYCAENTTIAKAMQEDQLTGVLLKATFKPKGAQSGDNFFMLNNTSAIYVETGDHGFLAWATAVLANSQTAGVPLTEGQSLAIKDNAEADIITNVTEVQALLEITSANPTSSELTENQASEILTAAGNNIKFYKGGVTYYYATLIKHFGDDQTPLGESVISELANYDEAKHLGRWGVLRNNWYELNITSVSGPGEPQIPDIPKDPADKTNSYINCEINILSWAKRSQSVEL